MKALSLFTGIMGIDLACEWAGIETIAMCEWDLFCQKVIRKHKPNIPLYGDIKYLSRERLEADEIDCGTIELIHGGYPCQPFSLAGKREGSDDDRYLWPEVKRLLEEIRPRWFVGENVPGHITLGLDDVLSELESIGYTAEPIVLPACAVNAPHRRNRVFIIAHTTSKSSYVGKTYQENGAASSFESRGVYSESNLPTNTEGKQNTSKNEQKLSQEEQEQLRRRIIKTLSRATWEVCEPPICGVDDGISGGLDEGRLKALGNSVVPQQIYPILAAIKQIDDMLQAV